jgi:hypothetical protein
MLSRRSFLLTTGGTLAAASLRAQVKNPMPTNLDHILLGCQDLQEGIAFVERQTGVHAAFGGVHPGRGTQNALLSLGDKHYLEIIAPDPKQADSQNPRALSLRKLAEPRIVTWAVHSSDLAGVAKKLRESGIAFQGPTPGSRRRPDGRLLQWQTLDVQNDASGLLPFFIQWSPDSPHPANDAPKGCRLLHFELVSPDSDSLAKTVTLLSLEVTVAKADKPQLRATVAGPKGEMQLSS